MTMATTAQQFIRFCAVGAVGFVVDAGTTLALVHLGLAGPLLGRGLAFMLASSVTWMLNKRFTFQASGGLNRWSLYVVLTAVGALLNVGVYALWIGAFGSTPAQIVVGILWGATLALAFNFTLSKYLIFRPGLHLP